MRKNFIYRAAALCALPFLFAACSQQDNELVNREAELAPLEISVGTDTRTIIEGSALPDGSQFGIFGVTEATGELQEDIVNVDVKYVNGECSLGKEVFLDERPTCIYAYYPYNYPYSDKATLNSVYVFTNDGTYDFLYGRSYNPATGTNATVNNAQPRANIYFKHAMAQIRLIAYKTADYEGDALVSYIGFTDSPLRGNMNPADGSIAVTAWGDWAFNIEPVKLNVEGKGTTTYRALAIPYPQTAHLLYIKLDGEYVYATLPGMWEAGQQYTYTLVVDKNRNVLVTKGEITPWENNTQGEITVGDDHYVE